MSVLIAIGFIFVLLAVIVMWIASRAPRGWEDEDGFHYGNPKDKS